MDSPIRLATIGDIGVLKSLMEEFYAEAGYSLDRALARASLAELIKNPDLGRLWLILHADQPVGYIAVTFGFSIEFYGRDAYIDDLFIQPAFRGAGLGTRVLDSIECECRPLGIWALHLEVERSNTMAQTLYLKRGFRDNDRQLLSKRLS